MKILIVVKIGGDLLKNELSSSLVKDIVNLRKNHKIVIVHGGADIVTDISTKLGHPPSFIVSPKGFKSRYTDKEEMKIFLMVMAGLVNKTIVATFEKVGVSTVGLSGVDDHLIVAKRKTQLLIKDDSGKKKLIEGGFTGKITGINVQFLNLLLDNDILPVISPIGLGLEMEFLNIDGDRAASSISSFLKADKLILLTDTPGVKISNIFQSHLNIFEAEAHLEEFTGGMMTKIYAAGEAIRNGVPEVHIASGYFDEPVTQALLQKNGTILDK
jgi:[amino group carrier protein]-L-2-aminoadipate 6-kinase